jgi:hypothetical protein
MKSDLNPNPNSNVNLPHNDKPISSKNKALYPSVLGANFQHLPPVLQHFHSGQSVKVQGWVTVKRSNNILVWLLLWAMKIPSAIEQGTCCVAVLPSTNKTTERWQRSFNGQAMNSRQTVFVDTLNSVNTKLKLHNKPTRLILEKSLLYTAVLHTRLSDYQRSSCALWQRSVGGYFLGIRLPRCLMPQINAREASVPFTPDSFSFNVRVRLPLFGTVLHYRGQLRVLEKVSDTRA